jgi:hypothetical protein
MLNRDGPLRLVGRPLSVARVWPTRCTSRNSAGVRCVSSVAQCADYRRHNYVGGGVTIYFPWNWPAGYAPLAETRGPRSDRRYVSNAERQAAYRARKAAQPR